SVGSTVRLGRAPAAISTTMVSPTARDTASTIAATTPEIAAGKTTRSDTRILPAPSAYAPSRSPAGTARIASSEIDATSGTISNPTATPATPTDVGVFQGRNGNTSSASGRRNTSAHSPIATVGMPSRISSIGLTARRTQPGAYSDR